MTYTYLDSLKAALTDATDTTIRSCEEEVRCAVKYIASLVRETYPDAKRVELEGSDQGDWLTVRSIDGDEEKLAALSYPVSAVDEDLGWASSCVYDAHRTASPALHSADKVIVERTDSLYIDIEEALK